MSERPKIKRVTDPKNAAEVNSSLQDAENKLATIHETTDSFAVSALASLTDPDADRIPMWDESANAAAWMDVSSGLTLSGTTLSATYPSQWSCLSANFDKTNATLADVTGLTADLVASGVYHFAVRAVVDPSAAGGLKLTFGGTATATHTGWTYLIYNLDTPAFITCGRATAKTTAVSENSGTETKLLEITGTITVNAAGTHTVQFAQASASGTSTVLRGATFVVTRIS